LSMDATWAPEDLEGLAEALYREAGEDPDHPIPVHRIARAIFGSSHAVELVGPEILRSTTATLARLNDTWRIFVRRGLSLPETNFLIGHELAHWALRREGYQLEEPDEELAANYLGAALVAPSRSVIAAVKQVGTDPAELAEVFDATQTLLMLRLGEATGRELALVRPGLIRVRGQLSFVWPDERTIVRWAKGKPPQGLAKTRLTDDRNRVALVVEDLDDIALVG